MKTEKSKFQFRDFIIRASNFNRNPSESEVQELDIDLQFKGQLEKGNKAFFLDMVVGIKDKKDVFSCEILITGFFSFEEFNDDLENYLYLNAPALLFPNVRAYVAALTSLGGLPGIVIPTMNLTSHKENVKKNTTVVE